MVFDHHSSTRRWAFQALGVLLGIMAFATVALSADPEKKQPSANEAPGQAPADQLPESKDSESKDSESQKPAASPQRDVHAHELKALSSNSKEPQPSKTTELPISTPPEALPQAFDDDDPAATTRGKMLRGPRQVLKAYGIGESAFRSFQDGLSLMSNEEEILLTLLYRLPRISLAQIDRWIQLHNKVDWSLIDHDPEPVRGDFFPLRGHVISITSLETIKERARALGFDQYYRCDIELAGSPRLAHVYTRNIPKAWKVDQPMHEAVGVSGLFLKMGLAKPKESDLRSLIFVAKRIAWHPEKESIEYGVHSGHVLLANLGMDIGLLDKVKDKDKILQAEREAFYQMLWAVGRSKHHALKRAAKVELNRMLEQVEPNQEKLQQMNEQLNRQTEEYKLQKAQYNLKEKDKQITKAELDFRKGEIDFLKMEIARTESKLKRTKQKEFSIIPLFVSPASQRGRIYSLKGIARRAVRINVSAPDVKARFEIDHYYEIYFFTKDSEDNPLVFLVRDLPENKMPDGKIIKMPEGENIQEKVRLTGFFFKTWKYRALKPVEGSGASQKTIRIAPMLIGLEPTWIPAGPSRTNPVYGMIGGICFVIAILGIWLGVWFFGRGDKKFHDQQIAKNFSLEQGASLNDLGIEAETSPDFSNLD